MTFILIPNAANQSQNSSKCFSNNIFFDIRDGIFSFLIQFFLQSINSKQILFFFSTQHTHITFNAKSSVSIKVKQSKCFIYSWYNFSKKLGNCFVLFWNFVCFLEGILWLCLFCCVELQWLLSCLEWIGFFSLSSR